MLAEEKYRHCCRALKDFAQQAGFAEVVFGLSGGIDSALVALMCVDAFGADKVHAVLLPGPFTSAASVDDAQELADRLGIALSTISITEAFQAFKQAFVDAGLSPLEASAAENTQARCRMICLMALSNMHRWMLVNTGNKSELLVGYSTMYGDMAGAFAPLGCLYKTEVYELSRWRNACEAKMGWPALISASILEKAPSAELAADQEDEKCLGISYAALDRILIALVEEGKSVEEAIACGNAAKQVEQVLALMEANAFKRPLAPPCPSSLRA